MQIEHELLKRFLYLHDSGNHDHSDEAWRLNAMLTRKLLNGEPLPTQETYRTSLAAGERGDAAEGAMNTEQPQFQLRGTMCTGSEEKVDGLKLIESTTNPENIYALVSPEFAPRLLQMLNDYEQVTEALHGAVRQKLYWQQAESSRC
jgi:hypothetical protein